LSGALLETISAPPPQPATASADTPLHQHPADRAAAIPAAELADPLAAGFARLD